MADIVLTPEQEAAASHRGGTLLVSAAAGSGKTRVLVERLMRYVCDPVQPEHIDRFLLITYTRAAAAELRAKISAELAARLAQQPANRHLQRQQVRIHSAQISTVHAFCADLAREFAHELDLTADFRVLEQSEAQRLQLQALELTLEQAYAELPQRPNRAELFDTLGAGRDDRALPSVVLTAYEQLQCHRDPAAWMDACLHKQVREDCTDALETSWGQLLLAQLHGTLDNAEAQLRQALGLMAGYASLEKSYMPTFEENLQTLRCLREAQSWDEVRKLSALEKGRLKPVRNFEDPELLEWIKTLRTRAFRDVESALRPFQDSSAQVLADLRASQGVLEELFALVQEFSARYRAEKERVHALDFQDLERCALRLLCRADGSPTATAQQLAARWREIMVDEYQDTNEVQDAIFRCVSLEGENRFLVGDVKQSIYRFRLADPAVFLDKYERYPLRDPAERQPACKVLLSQNFRSRPEILAAVNEVFCGVMSRQVGELDYGEAEQLRPGRSTQAPVCCPVELHAIQSAAPGDETMPAKAETEAAFVADRIAQLLVSGQLIEGGGAQRPVRPEDIVILMRSPRAAAPLYLEALRRKGIACVYERSEDLLASMEVQLLRALLQVVDNPRQDIPLAAVLLSPVFSFSAARLAQLRAAVREDGLYDALLAAEQEPDVEQFLQLLRTLRALRPVLPLSELTGELLRRTQLQTILSAMPEAEQRVARLQEFVGYVSAAETAGKTLSRFLEELEQLEQLGTGLPASPAAAANAVRIMSVHSSKGLEFPVVVLADLTRRFNQEDLRAQVLTHPKWGAATVAVDRQRLIRYPTIAKQALAQVKLQELKSEELRVLYVAMTRARELLILSCCSATMRRDLTNLAREAVYPVPPARAAQADCPADWLLQVALTRTDAGALHMDGVRPLALRTPETGWRIEYHEQRAEIAVGDAPQPEQKTVFPDPERLLQRLAYQYSHAAAAQIPAKLTATQLKGRTLDEELADGAAPEPRRVRFPEPDFLQRAGALTPAQRGTAMHLFMQFADYGACCDEKMLDKELQRLVREEFLTAQQAASIDLRKLLAFFTSELGRRVCTAPKLIREFKFSLLMPAQNYYPQGEGERVLLQGVVDCCLDEPEGLTILDFKTDRIRAGQAQPRAQDYAGQLRAYSEALSRIFEKPVRERLIYFFETGETVAL